MPVVPTVGNNPWHHHDFEQGELEQRLLEGSCGWRLYETVQQPARKEDPQCAKDGIDRRDLPRGGPRGRVVAISAQRSCLS